MLLINTLTLVKIMRNIILLVSVLNVPMLAATEFPLFFIGVKGGHQWALDDNYNHSNPEGPVFGVYSGFQFAPSWSWDLGYQYHNELKADVGSVNIRTWIIESALRYDWRLQDNLSLYGRFGISYWDIEKTQLFLNKSDAIGFSPLGEVGITYNFNSNIKLSTSYQYIDSIGKSNTGKYDSDGLLVSLTYTFGRVTQPRQLALIETASISTIEDIPVTDIVTVKSSPKTQFFLSKTTEFSFDSIELNHEFIEQLTGIASMLKATPQTQAVVVGYTDSTGLMSYNQKLSEHRALTIVNKLIELGVTPTQLEWRGLGQSGPIADNNTVEGRAKNRRVEIIISSFQF